MYLTYSGLTIVNWILKIWQDDGCVTLKTIISKVIITWMGFLENDENDVPLINVLIFHKLCVYQRGSWYN